jgi:hypothetical protein
LRYYLIVDSAAMGSGAGPPSADAWTIVTGFIGGGDSGPIPHHGGGGSWHRAPEMSAAGAPAALMLLLLGLIIWKDKP